MFNRGIEKLPMPSTRGVRKDIIYHKQLSLRCFIHVYNYAQMYYSILKCTTFIPYITLFYGFVVISATMKEYFR